MTAILTGPGGNLAYFDGGTRGQARAAFGLHGRLRRLEAKGAVRWAQTSANRDHAPLGLEAAVTTDQGLALLQKIAGKF